MNTLFLTAFYSPLIPVCMIYALFALGFQYWTDKWSLINRRSVLTNLAEKLSLSMIDLMEVFLPLFCFANIFFSYVIIPEEGYTSYSHNKFSATELFNMLFLASRYSLFGLIIGIVHYILPTNLINETLFQLDEPELENEYNRDNFDGKVKFGLNVRIG